jgi:hypothetical protein
MESSNPQSKSFAGAWIATLLGLFVVIGIIFWAVSARDGAVGDVTEGISGATAEATGTAGFSTPVREYLEFSGVVAGGDQPPPVGLQHEYAADGIRKLAAALDALAKQDSDFAGPQAAGEFRSMADSLQRDPASTEHADIVRSVFVSTATIMSTVDESDGMSLRRLAESIDPGRPLLDQRDTVQSFFRRSAEAIQRHSEQLHPDAGSRPS